MISVYSRLQKTPIEQLKQAELAMMIAALKRSVSLGPEKAHGEIETFLADQAPQIN